MKQSDSRESSRPGLSASEVCPACLGRRRRSFGWKYGHALWRCRGCGSIYVVLPPEDEGAECVKELYDHYYDGATFRIHSSAARSLDHLVRSCERYRSTGRWLDIGYGEGGLLEIVESHGWMCYGSEISHRALEYGARRGWTVSASDASEVGVPEGGVDVVTMVEFLEHVAAPDAHLRTAAAWLRPGGLLYVTTPNARSLNRWLLGARWSVFSPPEHLTLWTAGGLRSALARAGFRTRRLRTQGLNPYEVLARLRARVRGPAGTETVNRNQRAFELNDAFSRDPFRRGVKACVNRGLSWLQVGDDLKVWALRREPSSREQGAS